MENETLEQVESETARRGAPAWLLIFSLVVVLASTSLDLFAPPAGVPVTILLIWGLLRLGGEGFRDLGLAPPKGWGKTLFLGTVLALMAQLFATFVVVPLLRMADVPLPDFSRFEAVEGNLSMLLFLLFIAWVPAGFGEEVIWRGFFMTRLARLLGEGRVGWGLSLLLTSVIFGLLHAYQGPSGMILTGTAGLILGGIFLASGRNLWLAIFTHAMMDTLAFVGMYLGLLDDLLS